ncbi:MAG: N-acetyl-gamma-glutamyl-phosphate reductase [Clostridia bacterium]|nr:N-acetyl-gamma-glutamyl-phosphate reductase [Clostridia bacterium]
MKTVFIDGSAGTTGLRIAERLQQRDDIELLTLPESLRKDPAARREALNAADVSFLCLPDAAAKEAVAMATSPDAVIIDASTAHRTDDAFVYGFPELTGQREKIQTAKRIANPGCHATGFIALVRPLTEAGLLAKDSRLSCFSLTGYSGGGKKMIADYEAPENAAALRAPRMYGLSQKHKHLPEMQKVCGLTEAPVFCPVVSSYYAGMQVTVPLFAADVKGSAEEIKALYRSYYNSGVVKFAETDENGFLSAGTFAGNDGMTVSVFGGEDRVILVSRFDNLGKGASGAAIQNMNLALGMKETEGLAL